MQSDQAATSRLELMQGILDMLILRQGPAHGHEIAKHIQRTTDDVLRVEHGSLYPALHRLERKGWVSAKWETPPRRQARVQVLPTHSGGKKQLTAEHSKWRRLVASIGRVMEPAKKG
jgi:transcriptional regulator